MNSRSTGFGLVFTGITLLLLEEIYAIALLEKLGLEREMNLIIILLLVVTGLVMLLLKKYMNR
ncbi:hypothetical protein [Vibrio gallicus]|uniref:hypothetical protein n=1 Tax=Vibrio gallicus TaxID=190897 RepID=UPI0021C46087|nr:hypothetical protein [Vibrio gallicus]